MAAPSTNPRRSPPLTPAAPPPPGRLARLFEGWQLALLVLLIAGSALALTLPRSVPPAELPEPSVDVHALDQTIRADEALADRAERRQLDVDVRALGSALFTYGEADADGDESRVVRARGEILDAAGRALALGADAVLALRAHHLRTFLAELRRFEITGEQSDQLRRTGGSFVKLCARNGWLDARGHVVLDEPARRVAFKRRWNELTGVSGDAYALTLDEQRAFYRSLLRHPALPAAVADAATLPADARRQLDAQYRLKKVEELAGIDRRYPVHLARGVLLFEQQRYHLAVEAFRAHLDASPDGPWALRAQNHLVAALIKAQEEQAP